MTQLSTIPANRINVVELKEEIGGIIDTDGISITTNSSNSIQAVGVINQNNNNVAIKTWTGTKEEFDALVKDENTLYNVNDETEYDIKVPVLEALYPVGSIYIGTQDICPLTILIPNSQWQLVANDRVLQGAGVRGTVGTTINESLPNLKGSFTGSHETLTSFTGVFYAGANGRNYQGNTATDSYPKTRYFDASRYSSVYKDGAPVQQNAYLVNIWKRTV